MAKIKNPFQNIQIVTHRSNPLTKSVVIAAIVLSIAAVIALGWTQNALEAEIQQMREEAAFLQQENAELAESQLDAENIQGVMDIAQEELDLVDPDTILIQPQ